MENKVSLGDRMKTYENCYRVYLPRRLPLILRLDGKSFHTLTKHLNKPWDQRFVDGMSSVAKKLMRELQGASLAYVQSDEVSVLLTDYANLDTQAWFDRNLQKMVSVAASYAAMEMTAWALHLERLGDFLLTASPVFDARAFVIPKEEVCNYFIWRQQDAVRNSIQGLAQVHFSHAELHGLNQSQLQEKLFQEKGVNWNNCLTYQKRGLCVLDQHTGWGYGPDIDLEIPIFTQDRNYIEKWI